MTELFLVLLRILFPLDPVARLCEVTRDYISEIMGWLDEPAKVEEIHDNADLREILEAHIIAAENGVELLITERARQIAGLPLIYTRRMTPPYLRKAKSLPRLLNRITHLARLFHNLERLAQRRAERLQRELEQNPLRLAPSAQSTSPALCAGEANHRCLASLSAQHWRDEEWPRSGRIGPVDQFERRTPGATAKGRHARVRAHDGGGLFAQPRGPPPFPTAYSPLPTSKAPLSRTPPLAQNKKAALSDGLSKLFQPISA